MGIGLNIAEGNGRWIMRDRRSFIINARASAQEVEAVLFIAEDLEYITAEVSDGLRKSANEIGRMLNGLARYYAKT